MKLFLILTLVFASLATHSKGAHKHKHNFSDAKKWAKIFEATSRDEWQKPNQLISFLQLKKDSLIADIGSATGYFPVRIAKAVPRGRVWGIDVEANLVNYLNERKEKEGLKNVFSILGTYHDPLIPEKVDLILIVDTYHHIHKRTAYLNLLKERYLKPKAKVVIVDFFKKKLPLGPPPKAKLARSKVIDEFKKSGFKLVNEFKELPYQYALVFQ